MQVGATMFKYIFNTVTDSYPFANALEAPLNVFKTHAIILYNIC